MVEINFTHDEEKKVVIDAIMDYINRSNRLSDEWKDWLENIIFLIQTNNSNSIGVPNVLDFEEALYTTVFRNFLTGQRGERHGNEELFLNGLSYVNRKKAL